MKIPTLDRRGVGEDRLLGICPSDVKAYMGIGVPLSHILLYWS